MNPLVSIVVPSYQQVSYLRAAIDSVLAQDYEPVEILVMDGGSTDGSVDVLESYGDRIRFRSRRDDGQCDAINEGFRSSRGEIVAWLNSDDIYYPGAISEAVRCLKKEPDAGLVYGEGNLIDGEGELMWRFPFTIPFDLWQLANVADYILQPTVFFRREVLMGPNGDGEHLLDLSLNWGLDWDLWLRLGSKAPLAMSDQVLAAGRIYGDTKTATGGFKRLREIWRILRSHGARRFSPAAVAHTLTTIVRTFSPAEEPIETKVSRAMPGPIGRCVRVVERRLQRWLQNAQGLWSDGYAAKFGELWLPHDGAAARLVLAGNNLDLGGQVVSLRCGSAIVHTGPLSAGESFELRLEIPSGLSPVKLTLRCTKQQEIAALDASLGKRRAGYVIEQKRLVAL